MKGLNGRGRWKGSTGERRLRIRGGLAVPSVAWTPGTAAAALAHTVGGVEGAYFRSDLYARRRVLMDQWAAFLTGDEAKVVQLYG